MTKNAKSRLTFRFKTVFWKFEANFDDPVIFAQWKSRTTEHSNVRSFGALQNLGLEINLTVLNGWKLPNQSLIINHFLKSLKNHRGKKFNFRNPREGLYQLDWKANLKKSYLYWINPFWKVWSNNTKQNQLVLNLHH